MIIYIISWVNDDNLCWLFPLGFQIYCHIFACNMFYAVIFKNLSCASGWVSLLIPSHLCMCACEFIFSWNQLIYFSYKFLFSSSPFIHMNFNFLVCLCYFVFVFFQTWIPISFIFIISLMMKALQICIINRVFNLCCRFKCKVSFLVDNFLLV